MSFEVHTGAAVADALRPFVEADPVGATIVGTAVRGLSDEAWCAVTPRSYVGRTAAAWPVLVGPGWSDAELAEVAPSVATLPDLTGVQGISADSTRLTDLLGRSIRTRTQMRLFRLDELIASTPVPGTACLVDATARELLIEWYAAFSVETHSVGTSASSSVERLFDSGGQPWVWRDPSGTPVALACAH